LNYTNSEDLLEIPSKAQFHTAQDSVYLDTAAEGLPLDNSSDALLSYFLDKTSGTPGRERMFAAENDAVAAAAELVGTAPENIALIGNATDGLNLLGNSIRWKPGDEILITDLEFSSNVVSWLRLHDLGVKLEVIPSRSGTLELSDFLSRLRPATRLVSVSHVSYKSGTRVNFLRELAHEVHRRDALFVVDATQSLGRIPVDIHDVDFLVASSYKWLLGVHGLGVVYCSPRLRDRLAPGAAGWYSIDNIFAPNRFENYALKEGAARFVSGMPNFPSIYVLRDNVRFLLSLGVERIDNTLAPLVSRLRQGIEALGLPLLTPAGAEYASGIVSFSHPDAESLGSALRRDGIVVWAGDGRVRASVHLYNDESDIERLLASLASLVKHSAPSAVFT
jgi:selenocysteine lyase/cysteine desulfurase